MSFSIRTTIRGLVAPEHRLSCPSRLWHNGLFELKRRGAGQRESGAFLLGHIHKQRRVITRFAYYDDFDTHCLETGIVMFDGAGYGPLWQLCQSLETMVVADIHTHPGAARQSLDDQANPMIATPGHIALIVPGFAQRVVPWDQLGIYEYQGGHQWADYSGKTARTFFYTGWWG